VHNLATKPLHLDRPNIVGTLAEFSYEQRVVYLSIGLVHAAIHRKSTASEILTATRGRPGGRIYGVRRLDVRHWCCPGNNMTSHRRGISSRSLSRPIVLLSTYCLFTSFVDRRQKYFAFTHCATIIFDSLSCVPQCEVILEVRCSRCVLAK